MDAGWLSTGVLPLSRSLPCFQSEDGPLPRNQELQVEDVVEVATPAHWLSRIPRGEKNIFLIVRRPGNPAAYAVPMGEVQGGNEEFRMDDLL